jgi:hypothetical protein
MIATRTERTSEVFMLLLDAELSAAALFISPKRISKNNAANA